MPAMPGIAPGTAAIAAGIAAMPAIGLGIMPPMPPMAAPCGVIHMPAAWAAAAADAWLCAYT